MNDSSTVQEKMDTLVSELPGCLADNACPDEIVIWIKDFATINDNFRLRYDRQQLAGLLKAAGYTSTPATSERITIEKHGLKAYRDRLIEFSLHFLENGRAIPFIATRFADIYLAHTDNRL